MSTYLTACILPYLLRKDALEQFLSLLLQPLLEDLYLNWQFSWISVQLVLNLGRAASSMLTLKTKTSIWKTYSTDRMRRRTFLISIPLTFLTSSLYPHRFLDGQKKLEMRFLYQSVWWKRLSYLADENNLVQF